MQMPHQEYAYIVLQIVLHVFLQAIALHAALDISGIILLVDQAAQQIIIQIQQRIYVQTALQIALFVHLLLTVLLVI